MEGHYTLYGIDASFYYQLSEHDVTYENSETGEPEIPRPDAGQLITVIGTALLSSSVVATAIKTWLDSRKRKITLSVDGSTKKLEYEGPNIKQDAPAIQAMIDQLAEETKSKAIRITVEYLPEIKKQNEF